MSMPTRRVQLLSLLFLVILLSDLFSKYFTYHFIPSMDWLYPAYPYGGLGVFEDFCGISFSLNYVENRGGAWGLFASAYEILLAVRIALLGALFVYLCFYNKLSNRQLPLTLVLAGALGNVLDCLFYGHVIDMFHFVFWGYSYPVFNVADASICIGVALLVLQTHLEKRKAPYASF